MNVRRPLALLLSVLAPALLRAAPPASAPAAPPFPLEASDFDWIRNELIVREAEKLEKEVPRIEKGTDIKMRLIAGTDLIGSFDFASSNYFIVVRSKVESRQFYRELDPSDRLRLDRTYRDDWVKLSATARTWAILAAAKVPMPEPRAEPTWADLQRNGSPEEMVQFARRLATTWTARNPGERDPGHAALLLHACAAENRADAVGLLGRMYLQGHGVRRNGELALRMLAWAANAPERSKDAEDALRKFDVDSNRREMAVEGGAKWVRERQTEIQAHGVYIQGQKDARELKRKETLGVKEEPAKPDPKAGKKTGK